MIRGSTPTHIFNVPFDTGIIDALQIAYAQNDDVLFVVNKEDCLLDGSTIKLTLTQEQTLLFDCYKRTVQIQIKIKSLDKKVILSNQIIVPLEKCLYDEVI